MYRNQKIGKKGENIAAQYLEQNGYSIVAKNFSCRQGEIDIIAELYGQLIFIEVKARTNLNYGWPIDAVTKVKQKHMEKASKYYIYKNHLEKYHVRMDVIEVYIYNSRYRINHVKQIM